MSVSPCSMLKRAVGVAGDVIRAASKAGMMNRKAKPPACRTQVRTRMLSHTPRPRHGSCGGTSKRQRVLIDTRTLPGPTRDDCARTTTALTNNWPARCVHTKRHNRIRQHFTRVTRTSPILRSFAPLARTSRRTHTARAPHALTLGSQSAGRLGHHTTWPSRTSDSVGEESTNWQVTLLRETLCNATAEGG